MRKRLAAALAAGCMAFGLCQAAKPLTVSADTADSTVKTADGDTAQTYKEWLGDSLSTQYNGRVWADKSVYTGDATFTGDVGSVTVENDSDFLVSYSALATSQEIYGQQPADVVFVLDFSASMTWGVDSMSVSQEDGSDSRIQYMVNALNSAIDTLARANPDNRGNVGGLRRNENTDAGSENTGFCHSHPGKYHYDGRRGYYQ